jgi:hypothetical protein
VLDRAKDEQMSEDRIDPRGLQQEPDTGAARRPASAAGGVRPTREPPPTRVSAPQRGLAAATATLLAVDGYVHLHDAGLYQTVATGTVSQATLFRLQAAAAIVVAIALLIRPHPAVWVVAALVAGSAATAVLLYTNVDVGQLGPLPDMYEPTWALPGKPLSAAAEIAATVLALAGLAVSLSTRPRAAH